MRSTGCGKSSLLNVLSARVPTGNGSMMHLEGSVTVNGKPRNDQQFRQISAYVQQDDTLYTFITVYETLMLAAHFFLPIDTPLATKTALVDSIINDLSLKKARDTIIGNDKVRGISGGERRRTSIAAQMLTDPLVLFLDEPTSGLDSFQAQSVMEAMKLLSDLGRLVVAVIHQPRSSIYNMFDKLLLLSEGQTMFLGEASEAVEYFNALGYPCPESFNPSDFFLDLFSPDARSSESDAETKARIQLLASTWIHKQGLQKASEVEKDPEEIRSLKEIRAVGNDDSTTKVIQNFQLLCWRTWAEQSRDFTSLRIRFIITIFFAFLLGGIYSNIGDSQKSIQNRNGLLFFVVINQAFNTLFGILNTFPREKLIVNRERSGRAYSTLAYFIAKVILTDFLLDNCLTQ
jgi:ABC-type multidrug transport system ATPase subunit